MVIGIDCSISEFTCEETNLIPIQYGSVIYTNIKPIYPFLSKPTEPIKVGGTFHFPKEQFERLQRIFLYKPACWAYEEEIRIAKCLKGIQNNCTIQSGTFTIIEVDDRSLYLFDLPKDAIKEVYIGTRSDFLEADKALELIKTIRICQPNANVYGCKISKSSWALDNFELESAAKKLLQRRNK